MQEFYNYKKTQDRRPTLSNSKGLSRKEVGIVIQKVLSTGVKKGVNQLSKPDWVF